MIHHFREINYKIYAGVSLSRLPISFPECRCPQTHPQFVMDAADPSGVFCKQLTTDDKVRRLSNGTVDNMRDNDYNTVWTSSESMPTIYFTFDQVFMVSILRLYIVLNCVCGLTTAFIFFFHVMIFNEVLLFATGIFLYKFNIDYTRSLFKCLDWQCEDKFCIQWWTRKCRNNFVNERQEDEF